MCFGTAMRRHVVLHRRIDSIVASVEHTKG
jgi:hypothetical protein